MFDNDSVGLRERLGWLTLAVLRRLTSECGSGCLFPVCKFRPFLRGSQRIFRGFGAVSRRVRKATAIPTAGFSGYEAWEGCLRASQSFVCYAVSGMKTLAV